MDEDTIEEQTAQYIGLLLGLFTNNRFIQQLPIKYCMSVLNQVLVCYGTVEGKPK